jgi:hypothetical protein
MKLETGVVSLFYGRIHLPDLGGFRQPLFLGNIPFLFGALYHGA